MWDWKRLALSLSTLTLTRGERAGWHTEVGMPIMASSASMWLTQNTPIWSYNYKLVIHAFMVKCKHKSVRLWARKNIKDAIKAERNGSSAAPQWQGLFVMWRRRCYTLQHQTFFSRQGLSSSHKGETGQSGSREQLLSCQLGRQGDVARRVTPLWPVQVNPHIHWLLLPSLTPTCQVEKLGPGGQGLCTPLTGKGHNRGLVGPLRDDRKVRGPLRRGGVEPVEPLLKHSSACYPTPWKGRGVPICWLVLPGCSSFRG